MKGWQQFQTMLYVDRSFGLFSVSSAMGCDRQDTLIVNSMTGS